MNKGAPILRTAVRSKLRLELSYRDVSLPGTPIADEGTQTASHRSNRLHKIPSGTLRQ